MNKFKRSLLVFGCLFLSGCTLYSSADNNTVIEKVSKSLDSKWIEIREEKKALVSSCDETKYYFYDRLNAEDRILYDEIYDSLAKMKEEVVVNTIDPELLKKTFEFVMMDHPEIFYVDGYQYARYYSGEELKRIGFMGNYNMSEEEIKEYWSSITTLTDTIVTQMSQYDDQYDKAKALYDYIISNTDYELDCWANQNICSVLLKNVSVCQGYAKAYQFLLQRCGMSACLVSGFTQDESHAWNLVEVNGNYYYADPTWGDASYFYSEETAKVIENKNFDSGINYDYFLVTTDEIEKTHAFDQQDIYPLCISKTDNYYVKEHLYLQNWNYDEVSMMLTDAVKDGIEGITIKCGDEETYETVRQKLIEQQLIFGILDYEEGSIAYAFDDNQLTFSIWF